MSVSAPFTATWPTPIFPLRFRWLLLYIYFSVDNRQYFRTQFLHNYSDGDIYSMFFRMSSMIIPSIYSSQFSISCMIYPVDFPSVYFVCDFSTPLDYRFSIWYALQIFRACVGSVCFSIVLVFYSALWYAPDAPWLSVYFPYGKRQQFVYQFSAHAPNLESLIKRFIFPFKGIFSVLPIRTSTIRLSSDTRHLSS